MRVTNTRPTIRIGGREVVPGRLPGARLHFIKYAAPVCAVEVNRSQDGPLPAVGAGQHLELTRIGLESRPSSPNRADTAPGWSG